jgi:hypothetical protein
MDQVDSVLPADGWRPARRGKDTVVELMNQAQGFHLVRGGMFIAEKKISVAVGRSGTQVDRYVSGNIPLLLRK